MVTFRWGKDGISISGCQKNVFYSIFSQIRTVFEPVQGPCTMNLRNEPVHVMSCVVKGETHTIWRWKPWLCEFQHGKSISESGINNIGWRGLWHAVSRAKAPSPLRAHAREWCARDGSSSGTRRVYIHIFGARQNWLFLWQVNPYTLAPPVRPPGHSIWRNHKMGYSPPAPSPPSA